MAHSYIDYRGKYVHMNDGDIALVVYATLAHAAGMPTELPTRLRSLMERWATVIDDCGPGCIDLKLDANLATETDRQYFIDLVTGAEQRILAHANKAGVINIRQAFQPTGEQSIRFDEKLPVIQIRSSFAGLLSLIT
jgi:hypothetical protein